jgi:hypothetical protein
MQRDDGAEKGASARTSSCAAYTRPVPREEQRTFDALFCLQDDELITPMGVIPENKAASKSPRLTEPKSRQGLRIVGCGHDLFTEHATPELRIVRGGSRKLIAIAELERWLDQHAERVL